jgi:hypothetical protein
VLPSPIHHSAQATLISVSVQNRHFRRFAFRAFPAILSYSRHCIKHPVTVVDQ